MKNNFVSEIVVSVILVGLVVFLLNPMGAWMPNMAVMTAVISLLIIFVLFASFIWKEKARDEREMFHRMLAGRVAFLVGSAVLVVAVAVQGLKHEVDVWIVVALSAMVLAKLTGLIYSQTKH